PGHYLIVRNSRPEIRQYWDLQFAASTITVSQAEEQLTAILEESSRLHMISDVPVGFLLSGGLDSTAMLSLAVGTTRRRLSSFTIGFADSSVTDERPYARLAAQQFGTDHHEMTISSRDFAEFLPHYVWHMEEPVCEPPAVAMYYVSKLAKQYVKVLISGEGGDEAFGGYQNYRNILWLERLKAGLGPLRSLTGRALLAVNSTLKSRAIAKYAPLFRLPFESYYYSRTSSPFSYFNVRAAEVYSNDFVTAVCKD